MSSEYRPWKGASKPHPTPADADQDPPRGAPDQGPIPGGSGEPLGPPVRPEPLRDQTPRWSRTRMAIVAVGLVPLVAVIIALILQATR
jgi:hypothetical protein